MYTKAIDDMTFCFMGTRVRGVVCGPTDYQMNGERMLCALYRSCDLDLVLRIIIFGAYLLYYLRYELCMYIFG